MCTMSCRDVHVVVQQPSIPSNFASLSMQIPLPKVLEELLEAQMADIRARVDLSSDALPSTIFFTFVNTHQSLNCTSIAPDCTLVAGTPYLKIKICLSCQLQYEAMRGTTERLNWRSLVLAKIHQIDLLSSGRQKTVHNVASLEE